MEQRERERVGGVVKKHRSTFLSSSLSLLKRGERTLPFSFRSHFPSFAREKKKLTHSLPSFTFAPKIIIMAAVSDNTNGHNNMVSSNSDSKVR